MRSGRERRIERIKQRLLRKSMPRLIVTLILSMTAMSAFLTSFVLLRLGVLRMWCGIRSLSWSRISFFFSCWLSGSGYDVVLPSLMWMPWSLFIPILDRPTITRDLEVLAISAVPELEAIGPATCASTPDSGISGGGGGSALPTDYRVLIWTKAVCPLSRSSWPLLPSLPASSLLLRYLHRSRLASRDFVGWSTCRRLIPSC